MGSREALSCLFYLFLSPLRDIGSSNKSQCASNQMQGNIRQVGNCWAGGLDYKGGLILSSHHIEMYQTFYELCGNLEFLVLCTKKL